MPTMQYNQKTFTRSTNIFNTYTIPRTQDLFRWRLNFQTKYLFENICKLESKFHASKYLDFILLKL